MLLKFIAQRILKMNEEGSRKAVMVRVQDLTLGRSETSVKKISLPQSAD